MFKKVILLFSLLLSISVIFCPDDMLAARKKRTTRTMSTVKQEQRRAEKTLKDAGKKLNDNTRRTEQELVRLNQLEGEIKEKNREIDNIRTSLSAIDSDIKVAGDSLAVLEKNLAALKTQYAAALRKMQGNFRSKNLITFLFSASSFSDVTARYRYLREFSDWRKRKMQEISKASNLLGSQRRQLGSLQSERRKTLSSLTENESQLRSKRDETDKVVAKLKKEGSQLQKTIDNNQRKLKKLENELDRMILAEQKRQAEAQRKAEQAARQKKQQTASKNKKQPQGKTVEKPSASAKGNSEMAAVTSGNAESRALSGSFESNRGRLLFPVRGRYTIVKGFGRQTHPDLPNVVTDNPGIDIAASEGAKARSIFEGTVSGIFSQDGYNKVVMVRHGSYISIYANLSSINVRMGEKVRANQDLGTIYRDPEYGNKPVLHFELRRERAKLNPMQWIR